MQPARALSAKEISEACELPLSTTYRKLKQLTDAALLDERTPSAELESTPVSTAGRSRTSSSSPSTRAENSNYTTGLEA
jgi:DNA-binding IclR family transcriptional regulator